MIEQKSLIIKSYFSLLYVLASSRLKWPFNCIKFSWLFKSNVELDTSFQTFKNTRVLPLRDLEIFLQMNNKDSTHSSYCYRYLKNNFTEVCCRYHETLPLMCMFDESLQAYSMMHSQSHPPMVRSPAPGPSQPWICCLFSCFTFQHSFSILRQYSTGKDNCNKGLLPTWGNDFVLV